MAKKPHKSNNGRRNGSNNYRPRGDKLQGRQKDVIGTPYRDQDRMNKSNSSRKTREAMEAANDVARISRGNPLSFYTKYDRFVEDAARLPFSKPVGSTVTNTLNWDNNQVTDNSFVPGIMRLSFIPTIGVSKDFTSPINRSSIRFYTYLRSNQKASATYDHQDITMMEIALDSCYMYHGLMSRIYAILNQFTPANEYFSRSTIAACGVDFEDIRANIQDFRAYINAFAYSLGQYALPEGITLFDRHRWMVEGLYTDSTSTKAQVYMFVPEGFWQYDNTVTTGSQCVFKQYLVANSYKTFAQLKAFGDALLNAVSNEEDFAVISGDIFNFYGGSTYTLPYIDENYSVLPAYEEVVLSQIENATVMGAMTDDSMIISQNPSVNQGAIIFQPKLDIPNNIFGSIYLNFHHDSPNSGDVIEATRLTAVADESGNVIACGTEIITKLDIFTRSINNGVITNTTQSVGSVFFRIWDDAPVTNIIEQLRIMMLMAQFDWAPQVQFWYANTTTGAAAPVYLGTTWDQDNFDVIAKEYLANIHLGCLLSLFKVGTNSES